MEKLDEIECNDIVLDHIVSIASFVNKVNDHYRWVSPKKKKFMWMEWTIPGYWRDKNKLRFDYEDQALQEEILSDINSRSDLFIENNIVYYRPFMQIYMTNKSSFRLEFQTEEQLQKFFNEKFESKLNFLKT